MTFVLNWLFTSIAIAIADYIVPGIFVIGPVEVWLCYVFCGLTLSLVNSFVKPLVSLLSLPITIVTLGIFQLVVNGLMLQFASQLSLNLFHAGIVIDGFGAAFGGAIIVSIMCTLLGVRKS